LTDDLEVVLAPVPDVDEGVAERRSVVADEVVALAEDAGGGADVRGDEVFEEALEFGVGEADAVEGFEFLAKIAFEGGVVADVGRTLKNVGFENDKANGGGAEGSAGRPGFWRGIEGCGAIRGGDVTRTGTRTHTDGHGMTRAATDWHGRAHGRAHGLSTD
jgi:hypothetical protein